MDLIIPTMWKVADFTLHCLREYVTREEFERIILIDNDAHHTPVDDILSHPKITLLQFPENIYVNPAWNVGYENSSSSILCIANDDLLIDRLTSESIPRLDWSGIDLIGINTVGTADTIADQFTIEQVFVNKSKPLGVQYYGFGACMFIKRSKYKLIPDLYQIWYGDDYLVHHCDNIFVISTIRFQGTMSATINAIQRNSDIARRIQIDEDNAYKYLLFPN